MRIINYLSGLLFILNGFTISFSSYETISHKINNLIYMLLI